MIECLLTEKELKECFYCDFSNRDVFCDDVAVRIKIIKAKELDVDCSVLESVLEKVEAMSDFDYQMAVLPFLKAERKKAYDQHTIEYFLQLQAWKDEFKDEE